MHHSKKGIVEVQGNRKQESKGQLHPEWSNRNEHREAYRPSLLPTRKRNGQKGPEQRKPFGEQALLHWCPTLTATVNETMVKAEATMKATSSCPQEAEGRKEHTVTAKQDEMLTEPRVKYLRCPRKQQRNRDLKETMCKFDTHMPHI